MPTTPKQEIKQKLIAECLKRQQEVVDNARKAMKEAQASAVEYDDNAEDNMTDSYREEMQDKRDMFARQLEHAMDDLGILNRITSDKENEVAQFGAAIITEEQRLFVAISLGQITIENQEPFFAVSASAPIYKAMSGKKAGETFDFRDKKIKILEVY